MNEKQLNEFNELTKRVEAAEKIIKEVPKIKLQLKELEKKLIPSERFELMMDTNTKIYELQKENCAKNHENSVELTKIKSTIESSIVHTASLGELFFKTKGGRIVLAFVLYAFLVIVLLLISYINDEIKKLILDHFIALISGGAVAPTLIALFMNRKEKIKESKR